MKDITEKHLLGVPVARMVVLEYQKIHLLLLIILRTEDILRAPEDIDTYISTEIPNPSEDP